MLYPHADRSPRQARAIIGLLAAVALAVTGCATSGPRLDPFAYSPERLLVEVRAQAPEVPVDDFVVPYRVTPEMVARAREIVAGARTDLEKAGRLVRSITRENGFGLAYNAVATSTPEVTLERGYGNCLALTSIFIGLARELGMTAYYVDASDLINDLRRGEEVIIDSGHIAGAVRTERGYTLVDFDGDVVRFRTFKIIDDVTALAHYYNNLGFEIMVEAQQAGEPVPWEEALRNFELATKVRPEFTLALNNLGVAYTRLDDLEAAETAYRMVIAIDPESDSAYHNLGNLQSRRGDLLAALSSYGEALKHRRRNPYLHYHRGVAQYRLGDLVGAEESFKRAISLEREYIEPRNLLAQVYTQQGRLEEAAKVRAAVSLILSQRR